MDWVCDMWKQGAVLDVVDKRLGGEFDGNEVVVVIKLAWVDVFGQCGDEETEYEAGGEVLGRGGGNAGGGGAANGEVRWE